jgi:hypothetical protein
MRSGCIQAPWHVEQTPVPKPLFCFFGEISS